jgi:integrase
MEATMATGRITKRAVDATKPSIRDAYLWDSELAGFGLKVTPTGGKTYLVQYRLGGRKGRTRRVTIGRHGSPWTPESARNEAKKLLGQTAAGHDPAEERTRARREPTVAELCDLYLEAAPNIILKGKGRPKKASTLAIDRSNIERHIKPLLGRRRIGSIRSKIVRKFQEDIAAGKSAIDIRTGPRGRARVTGGRGTAARATTVLGTVFTFALREGYITENPVRGVELFEIEGRERFLDAAELGKLGEALNTTEAEGLSSTAITAIRLLIFTGCRKNEILGLIWRSIDFERGCLFLPDSKTGKKTVPLAAPALELLASLPRIEGSPFVFPATKGKGHYVGLPKVWSIIRKRAGLDDVPLQALRHSFASFAVAGGNSLYLIGKVLGHSQNKTTEKYAHLDLDPLKPVVNRTAQTIVAAMSVRNGGAEVVELPKRKA